MQQKPTQRRRNWRDDCFLHDHGLWWRRRVDVRACCACAVGFQWQHASLVAHLPDDRWFRTAGAGCPRVLSNVTAHVRLPLSATITIPAQRPAAVPTHLLASLLLRNLTLHLICKLLRLLRRQSRQCARLPIRPPLRSGEWVSATQPGPSGAVACLRQLRQRVNCIVERHSKHAHELQPLQSNLVRV